MRNTKTRKSRFGTSLLEKVIVRLENWRPAKRAIKVGGVETRIAGEDVCVF